MRRRARAALAAAALLATALALPAVGDGARPSGSAAGATTAPPTRAAPVAAPALEFDDEVACLEPVPAAASAPGLSDDGRPVRLSVLVLLDGVPEWRARRFVAAAARAYAPVRTTLAVTYASLAVPSQGAYRTYEGGPVLHTVGADRLIELAKRRVGGTRPRGVDLVYALTAKDLFVGGPTHADRSYGLAGLADCIGGVRYPTRAFAVGEVVPYEYDRTYAAYFRDATAKVLAHELGHLLGAHHHYANCAESGAPGACTLMFNFVDMATLRFSTLSAATVRGHSVRFAAP